MLIPSLTNDVLVSTPSLSRRVNANSQLAEAVDDKPSKLIKKGEC